MPEERSRRRPIPAEQRVFSLVLALVASPQGRSKRDLLASVHGYADRYRPGVVDPALERQFERDKDQIRALGIPIETIDAPEEPGNTQLTRYRISKELLEVPTGVRFGADELRLLRLASLAWAEGSLSAESRRATMKLESLGAGVDAQHLGIAPNLGIPEPAAPAVQRAITEGRVIRFPYLLPGRDAPLERRVAPLHLHRAAGRWHLLGVDLDRDADRVFLLSRITGEVAVASESFPAELRARVDRILEELLDLEAVQRAELLVRTGSRAHARLLPRAIGSSAVVGDADGFEPVNVGTLDWPILEAELAGYGDEVVVVAPSELRDRVVEQLRRIRDQHAENPVNAVHPDGGSR